jgi:hypothetical protein
MPTQEEYKARLLPLLNEAFSPHMAEAARVHRVMRTASTAVAPEAMPQSDVVESAPESTVQSLSEEEKSFLVEQTAAILAELEKQNQAASQIVNARLPEKSGGPKRTADVVMMAAPEAVAPVRGHSKKGVLLHYLHNPPQQLSEELDALPELRKLWDAAAQAAAPSTLEDSLFTESSARDEVSFVPEATRSTGLFCGQWGDIYGTGKYETLDTGWAWVLKNNLLNLFPDWLGNGYGIADFVRRDAWKERVQLQPGTDGKVRIAILGDWGSGQYKLDGLANPDGPACAVMDTLASLPKPPDCLIHLGDTYYTGTGANRSPEGEETDKLIKILKMYAQIAKPGCCFMLNSNHEMYGGAHGYYNALSNPLFSRQKGCSYFALEFGNWIIAGIDSAYFTPSTLYMDGGLGKAGKDPQRDFLQQIKTAQDSGKKVILMSHHTGLTPDGGTLTQLWKDVTAIVTPNYWYWGHLHLGIFYKTTNLCPKTHCRCIGHSSMPFAIPPGMKNCAATVDWYSKTPLNPQTARAKNGFAMLTLSNTGITEEVYDMGNTTPVWKV